ncbi:unnamed protein product [Soboliphyme baturini]|uniref:Membrane-associated kinase regulator n=1 Tax=Soboliphyme baturini TaxID=241478 RepID=A0A183J8Q8_9BILA|nr:unnamed protein product [Soboliphyme baturini]
MPFQLARDALKHYHEEQRSNLGRRSLSTDKLVFASSFTSSDDDSSLSSFRWRRGNKTSPVTFVSMTHLDDASSSLSAEQHRDSDWSHPASSRFRRSLNSSVRGVDAGTAGGQGTSFETKKTAEAKTTTSSTSNLLIKHSKRYLKRSECLFRGRGPAVSVTAPGDSQSKLKESFLRRSAKRSQERKNSGGESHSDEIVSTTESY